MNRPWKNITISLFFIWGTSIITYYFYSFIYYGEAFISSIALSIALTLGTINIIALYKIILSFIRPNKKIRDFIPVKKEKIFKKINNLKIPIYYFPVFLYLSAILWIIWIYFQSSCDIVILGNNIITLFLVSWIFLTSFSLGYKALKILKYKTEFFLEKFLFSCALGFGILMFIMYFLGMLGLYYRSIAYILMILVTILTYREIKELWIFLKNKNNYYELKKIGLFEKVLLFLIPIILGIHIAGIFQQFPSGYDAFYCYLTYPETFVENHSIVNFPYWVYFGFPQNGEMIFVLGLLLFNFQIVLGIIYIFTVLIALLVYYFFKKNKIRGGLYATVICLTIPNLFYQNLEDHKITIIYVFYVMLSYILFINYIKSRNKKELILFSIFCGISAGLKYFFLGWHIVPLALFFLIEVFRKKLKVKELFIWGLIIFVLMLPWFFKNIKFSGNPIDPILSKELSSKQFFYNSIGIDSQKYIVENTRNESYLFFDDEQAKGINYFLKIPFKTTFRGYKKYISDALNIGFVFIIFTPVVIYYVIKNLLVKRLKKELIILFFSIILLYIGWIYIGHVIIWYSISLFALFSILISQVFLIKNKYFKIYSHIVLIIWIVTIMNYQFSKRVFYPSLYTRNSNIIERKLFSISEYINKNISSNELIWGLDEPRGYYIKNTNNRFIQDNYMLTFGYLLKNKDKKDVIKFLKNYNIKYFLWNRDSSFEKIIWANLPNGSNEYKNLTLNNHEFFLDFKRNNMELITEEGGYYLYKLKEK